MAAFFNPSISQMRLTFFFLFIVFSHQLLLAQLDTLTIYSPQFKNNHSVFIYNPDQTLSNKPIIYFTDGQKMINQGTVNTIIHLIENQKIPPAYFIFVSSIDPEHNIDRRNDYFFCNPDYVDFFEQNIIPRVEAQWPISFSPAQRSLVGISFGGLNAAYFSARSTAFKNYGLLSPITYPCPDITSKIIFSSQKNLRLYLSTGHLDAETYVQPLTQIYRSKKYHLKVVTTSGKHDFDNWNAQLPKLLQFLLTP